MTAVHVSPLLTHWRYCSLALSHRHVIWSHTNSRNSKQNNVLCHDNSCTCGHIEVVDSIKMITMSPLVNPDSKVHGANMGPTWVLSAPDGPHVGPMNLAMKWAPFFRHFKSASRWMTIFYLMKHLLADNMSTSVWVKLLRIKSSRYLTL